MHEIYDFLQGRGAILKRPPIGLGDQHLLRTVVVFTGNVLVQLLLHLPLTR